MLENLKAQKQTSIGYNGVKSKVIRKMIAESFCKTLLFFHIFYIEDFPR